MRKAGRRTLAGVASGALVLAGAAFIAAPSAQAAPTIQAFCDTNNAGGGGVLPDPTTVVPNCVVNAGLGVQATIQETVFGAAATNTWYRFTVIGDSVFQTLPAAAQTGIAIASADGKSVVADAASMNTGAPYDFWLTVPTQGTRTVLVESSTLVSATPPGNADFAAAGDLTVTGSGASTTAVTSQAYAAVAATEPAATGIAPIGIVHLVDSGGSVLDLTGAAIGPITSAATSGTIGTALYTAGDCAATGLLAGAVDPGDTRLDLTVTDACATAVGAGVDGVTNSGLWITWTGIGAGTAVAGNYAASFNLTLGGQTYPVTVNYTVSNNLAVSSSGLSFNKNAYALGELVTARVTLRDAGGRIVPDGLGWTGLGAAGRTWGPTSTTTAPIFNPTTGVAIAPNGTFPNASGTTGAATYKGVTTGLFLAPPTPLAAFTMTMVAGTLPGENGVGWANALFGTTTSATARIGDPPPPPAPTMLIEGTRGAGSDANRVFVEGTSTGLVGQVVTPFFRFPGQTGFTAGVGLRTVDADGNFNWQRKTGKRIAVQFRYDGTRSNTIIIAAR
jgi:hypothetical protein